MPDFRRAPTSLSSRFAATSACGAVSALAACIGLIVLAGCYEYKVKYDGWEVFRSQVGDAPAPPPKGKGRPEETATGYAVLLESFEGTSRYRRANDLMKRLAQMNVRDLWMKETGQGVRRVEGKLTVDEGKVSVFSGRFAQLSDLDAQQSLSQIRGLTIDGDQPYQSAQLVSLGTDSSGRTVDSLDLRTHSGQNFYTLQIGFYDEQYGPDFREAAEIAAKQLRGEGEKAFYYHGRFRSLVTIELFTDKDFERDGPVSVYGPRVLQLQQRYKHNLGNGVTIMESLPKQKEKTPQPSFLVRVP